VLLFLLALLAQEPAQLPPGEVLYNVRCKGCHAYGQPGIPQAEALKAMSAEAVIRSLERGNMKVMGSSLTAEEKRQVAEFVTAKPPGSFPSAARRP